MTFILQLFWAFQRASAVERQGPHFPARKQIKGHILPQEELKYNNPFLSLEGPLQAQCQIGKDDIRICFPPGKKVSHYSKGKLQGLTTLNTQKAVLSKYSSTLITKNIIDRNK